MKCVNCGQEKGDSDFKYSKVWCDECDVKFREMICKFEKIFCRYPKIWNDEW